MDKTIFQKDTAGITQKPLPSLGESENTSGVVANQGKAVLVRSTGKQATVIQPELELPATSPPPSVPALSSDKIVLGEALDEQGRKTNHPITLGVEELFAGTHVLGIPRHGKTALLINLFLQLAQQGYGACYIDPHGDAITDILARLPLDRKQDVIILDPTHETHSFGLNLLRCDNVSSDTQMTYAYDQLWSVFTKLWADKETGEMGIWMQKFVSNAILTFLEHPGYTVADIPLLLTSKAHREYFARTLKNSVVAWFWTVEFDSLPKNYQWVEIESTLTRLNRFLQNPIIRFIVGQGRSTINFREIMDTKKLLLVHFPVRLPEDFRTLLGAMLITQLQDAMFSRVDTPKPDRVPFFLLVDEVQEVATKQFTKFIEEGGKYHVATIAAHQHLSQEGLSLAVRNGLLTAGNKVYLRINDTDAEIVAPGFAKAPVETPLTIPRDVLPYLKYHQHPFVKSFYAAYLAPLEEALAKEGIRYDHDSYMTMTGEHVRKEITIYPMWNFGSGNMRYTPDEVRKLRIAWNDLLYETQEQQLSKENLHLLWRLVVVLMSRYLDYGTWYDGKYCNMWPDITYRLDSRTNDANETIAKLTTRVEELDRILASDDSAVMHFYNGGWDSKQNTYTECDLETAWERLREEAAKFAKWHKECSAVSVESYIALFKQPFIDELAKFDQKQKAMRGFFSFGRPKVDEKAETIYLREQWFPVAQVREALTSDTAFLEFSLSWRWGIGDHIYKKTLEQLRGQIQKYVDGQQEQAAKYVLTNTPEKLLAVKRKPLEEELIGKKQAIEHTKKQLEMGLTAIKEDHERWLKEEQTRHDTFTGNLNTLLGILQDPQYTIRVTASNASTQREKTAGEMIDLTAMELRGLPKYSALCKIVDNTTTAIHRLSLLPLPPPHSGQVIKDMAAHIWQRMEAEYYRPKAVINSEIARRQALTPPETGTFVKLPGRS